MTPIDGCAEAAAVAQGGEEAEEPPSLEQLPREILVPITGCEAALPRQPQLLQPDPQPPAHRRMALAAVREHGHYHHDGG